MTASTSMPLEAENFDSHLPPDQRARDAPNLPKRPVSFVFYCLRGFFPVLAIMLIMETGQAACQILLPKAIQKIMDGVAGLDLSAMQNWQILRWEPLLLFIALNFGILIFSRISGALLVMTGPQLRKSTRAKLYNYLQYHSQRFFLGNFAGSLANRVSEVAVSVNHTLWVVMFDFWPIAVTFSVSMILLAQVHAGLATFLGAWIFCFVLASYLLGLRCRDYAQEFAAKRSIVTGKIVDAVTNIQNTKLFAHLAFERSYLNGYLDMEVASAKKTFWFMEKIRWFNFTSALILQVVMVFYALKVWSSGQITIGEFSMAASLAILIIADARNLSRRFLEYFEYIGNVSDGVNIIVRPHEVTDIADAKTFNIKKGLIQFNEVHFQYRPQVPVFAGLNVTIPPGQKVGLVGFSGSGKTTFVNLILRLFDIQKGQITIDGQDIHEVTQDSLRAQLSMIPQDPMLFHRSLMENIRYGNLSATDTEVIAAAKAADAHDFILSIKDGYQALVGERGVKLSGGQRQRIAIARAILKNAPILVMDEATSSLDSITEKQIQLSLSRLMQGRTVVVIAHRLSTIANLDRILVFDRGRIIEDGSHAQLLSQKGQYSRLWNMQAGGFLPSDETTDPAMQLFGAIETH